MTGTALDDLTGRWWDWRVDSWDGTSLRLIGDNDLTYHHAVTVTFTAAAYIACPMEFSHPVFRSPTDADVVRVRSALDGDLGGVEVFAWDLDDVNGPGKVCLVAAESVSVVVEHIAHQ